MGRRSRKRRSGAAPGASTERAGELSEPRKRADTGASTKPTAPSRSERRNADARAALEPLSEGERPRAVTIGALVALALGLGNLVAYFAGTKIGGHKPGLAGIASFSALMLVAAAGMWRRRYWAVLGMQALLALTILTFGVLLTIVSNAVALIVCLVTIGCAGALFWFLVKALARLQMPQRPT